MKKIITFIAAAAALAVSCQKENTPADKDSNSQVEGKLTATIVQTKVSYTETTDLDLQPAWEIGDKIIGFDDAGNTYTLTVASVSAETATLNGTVPDGALHLIYKSGAQASGISSKTLAIDYTAQAGDKTMPAVMLADGTVEDGACNFAFTNAGAIIGISAVNGVPSGSIITKVTIWGENLSAATVALSGSALALTATTNTSDTISTATLSGITTTDANGTLSSPVFIAVPAGAKIAKVSVALQARVPETMTIPSLAAEKKNIDYVEIEAKYDGTNLSTKKWAKWNVGASSQSDYGWYFAWAGTEGYVRKNDQWVSASGVDSYSYTLSSAKTTVASDYLYVKTQSFTTAGFSFDWEHAPYHTGSSSSTGWTKYIPTAESSYWSGTDDPDNKLVLDPEDDAATVNWGGTWRMPTNAEFMAMYNATKWTLDTTDKGYYVTKKGEALSADKSNALLFFPTTGGGFNASLYNAGSRGRYWSSSLSPSYPYHAFCASFASGILPWSTNYRCYGFSVRPLSD
ncbi:MAG: hypothetical protein MJY62_06480 [Bacteroidales bacterium]|nr:hypothetical protein [Bacteroidales bacterium]